MPLADEDAVVLEELLKSGGIVHKVVEAMNEDYFPDVESVFQVKGSTVEEIALNHSYRKGLVDGLRLWPTVAKTFAKEKTDD